MHERLFAEQARHDADIVTCNHDLVYADRVDAAYCNIQNEVISIKEMGYPFYFKKYFCMPRPNNYVWSRIIRSAIPKNYGIRFEPVDISEDTIFTMFCTAFANKVVHISDSYYNYYQRANSTVRETVRRLNIAKSYVHAFNCVAIFVKQGGHEVIFDEIMPLYAATRARSILFYTGQAGVEAGKEMLLEAFENSIMPDFLQRALEEGMLDDEGLIEKVQYVLDVLR